MSERNGERNRAAGVLDAWGMIALVGSALALAAAYQTENHMGMGVFMGLFIALLCGATLMLGCTRIRSLGWVGGTSPG